MTYIVSKKNVGTYDPKKESACSIVPWKAILPLANSTTWWNSSKTPEAGWCTEHTTSLPPMANFLRRDTTAAAAQLSRPVVGSSQNRIGGSFRSCGRGSVLVYCCVR